MLNQLKEELEKELRYRDNSIERVINSWARNKANSKRLIDSTQFIDESLEEGKKVNISYRIYCIISNIHNKESLPRCPICNKIRAFKSATEGFFLTCGRRKCYQKHPETNKKRQETAKERYGSLTAAYHDTAQKTIEERYGVDNVSKLEEIKQKKIETSRENWGTDYPWQTEEGKIRQKQGVINKYNVDNVSQLEEIKEKKVSTSLENWGVENPSQCMEVRKKILESNGKIYKFPSGREVLVDGNESFVLNYLITRYEEDKIIPQPEIKISYSLDDGSSHYWFPDVLIEQQKPILIEIKNYTTLGCEHQQEPTRKKIISGLNNGYQSFLILDNDPEIFALALNSKRDSWYFKILKGRDRFLDIDIKYLVDNLEKFGFENIVLVEEE